MKKVEKDVTATILTRKKPWNRVNLPVYSISSTAEGICNMNIITYVTAISMQPKRFICGIYQGTKTLLNVESSGRFVLQILGEQQYNLVPLLGKQSGKKINKEQRLKKRKALTTWNDFLILQEALAVMEMKVLHDFDGGDHRCFLCEVVAHKNLHNGTELTLHQLREKGIILA